MANTYFTSDLHFGDPNIIRYERRPWSYVLEMNEDLIKRWNEVVTPDDTVWFLGDLFTNMSPKLVGELVRRLNGHKRMVMGNHDQESIDFYTKDCGFEFVSPHPVILKDFFILSHEPAWVLDTMSYYNIFGHVHNDVHYITETPQSFCVCTGRHNYAPVRVPKFDNFKD